MMPWVRIDVGIFDDPAIGRMAVALSLPVATIVGSVVGVLAKVPLHAADGDLSTVADRTIEQWAQWDGKRGTFAGAIRAELCTREGLIRGWEKHNGAAIREAKAAKERMRKLREAAAQKDEEPPPVRLTFAEPFAEQKENVTEPVTTPVRRTFASNGTLRNGTEQPAPALAPTPLLKSGVVQPEFQAAAPHPHHEPQPVYRPLSLCENDTPPLRPPELSPIVDKFLARFYRSATAVRKRDIEQQLASTLTPAGTVFENGHVRAVDPAHLDAVCAQVILAPPRALDVAIVFVLKRLRTTFTEVHALRLKDPPRPRPPDYAPETTAFPIADVLRSLQITSGSATA